MNLQSIKQSFVAGFKMGLKQQHAWKTQLVSWLVADATRVLIMVVLLFSVTDGSRLTSQEVLMYFGFTLIGSRLLTDHVYEHLSKEILSGNFYLQLLRPGSFIAYWVGDSVASRLYSLNVVLPIIGVLTILYFTDYANVGDFKLLNFLFLVVILPLGFLLNFIMGTLFALVAFYVKQLYGLKALYNNLISVLGGGFMPLKVFPTIMFLLSVCLPFRYGLSFPIEIAMGWLSIKDIIMGVLVMFIWLIVLSILLINLRRNAIYKFEAEGL